MTQDKVVAISGGVGGAKLALGLRDILPEGALSVIVNTGDDFDHLGLRISPDVDTLTYTLAGLANTELGWGRAGETWGMMAALSALGGPDWFRLGDQDLALHLLRTDLLRQGRRLTEITAEAAARLGAGACILPMSDDPVATVLSTDEGRMDFQPWFVGRQAQPRVRSISYVGAAEAHLTEEIRCALAAPDLTGVVICPSNPWLSIGPVLAVPGLKQAIRAAGLPVVVVSPLIAGKAVKGPTAKILADMGVSPGFGAIRDYYEDLADGYVVDEVDLAEARQMTQHEVAATATLMATPEDKRRVAHTALHLLRRLRHG